MAEEVDRLVIALEARIRDYERNLDKAAKKAGTTSKKIENEFKGMEAGMSRNLAMMASKFDATFAKMGKGAIGAFKGLGASMIAAAGVASVGAAFGKLGQTIKEVADLGDFADRLGMSAEAIQEIQMAGKLAGVEVGDIDAALQKFSINLGKAARGEGGQFQKVLEAYGISLRDANGQMKSQMQLMSEYAGLVGGAGSEMEKLDLITLGYGKSSAAMVALLGQGTKAFEDQIKVIQKMSATINNVSVKAIQELDDEITKIGFRWDWVWKKALVGAVGFYDYVSRRTGEMINQIDQVLGTETPESVINRRFVSETPGVDPFLQHATERRARVAAENIRLSGPLGGFAKERIGGADLIAMGAEDEEHTARVTKALKGEADARKKVADAAALQAKRVKELIADLDHELAMIGKSAVDQRVATEIRNANVAAASDEAKAIEMKVRAIAREEEALENAITRMDNFRDVSSDVFGGFAHEILDGEKAIDALGNALDRLSDRMLDLALSQGFDALFGKPGTPGGGTSGSAIASFLSMFAQAGGSSGGGTAPLIAHKGGTVGGMQSQTRHGVSPMLFANAPRYHSGGIAGEVPAILQRGEIVVPRGGARGAGMSGEVRLRVQLVDDMLDAQIVNVTEPRIKAHVERNNARVPNMVTNAKRRGRV